MHFRLEFSVLFFYTVKAIDCYILHILEFSFYVVQLSNDWLVRQEITQCQVPGCLRGHLLSQMNNKGENKIKLDSKMLERKIIMWLLHR